jgi:hypothetical protein
LRTVYLVVISFFVDQSVLLMISALDIAMQQRKANGHNFKDNQCSLKKGKGLLDQISVHQKEGFSLIGNFLTFFSGPKLVFFTKSNFGQLIKSPLFTRLK